MASNYTHSDCPDSISECSSTSSTSSKIKDDLLNEILMCGICLSRMTSPCCLPCAHSFCRSCLLDYAQNTTINSTTSINFIHCPYCKYQLNFRSFEHFESMLIINPILKQLCEALDASKSNNCDQQHQQHQQQQQTQSNGIYRARCHTCGLLKMLKICKHCSFMLCENCRRSHLLDVHRESKLQLNTLETRIEIINKKRLEMDKKSEEYNNIRERIQNYAQRFIHQIEQQRDQALQIINDQQNANDEIFWSGNGFDNGEKLDFFNSLLQTGQKKLFAKNITDKDLMELSDNLQTIPDINEKLIELIQFTQLVLELDEKLLTKQFIRVCDTQETTKKNDNEKPTDINSQI
ncbi:unnamed protein product [Adineta steineri]|uniref:RING-type domain-containing protein n=1 Tax=Adineta steineri TaxID=433720 RepID=A0A813W9F8_9BILA|nr:unnamed protein product [Adineta steineri]